MSRIKEFTLPDLGEGLTEGEILAWLVKVGDTVELNQPIVEVETAKAAVEIPAKWAGQITRIFHEAGTVVEVGAPIVAIDTDPSAGPVEPAPSAASLAAVEVAPAEGMVEPGMIGGPAPGGRTAVLVGYGPRTTTAKRRPRRTDGGTPPASAPPAAAAAAPPVAPSAPPAPVPAPPATNGDGPVLAKPPVRKLARDLGVDLATLTGSGPHGSITRADVERAVAVPEPVAAAPAAATVAAPIFDASREQRVPVKGVRKLTAQNMSASAFTAPHVTEFVTVDVTRGMKVLDKLREHREWRDVKVSPLLLAARAVVLAVTRHPMVNSTWAGDEIVVKEYVNLGIAAATQRGLIVPNIKDAGRLSLRELAEALNALVATARSGKTPPADMSGGTLSITNVGVFGIDTGTPILPPGETAILCLGAIRPTPWVHKGKIRIRQVTTLGLSFDHRIVDGELGSRFLADVAAFMADPEGCALTWG
ncbi:dihydrolipoamide acetyltransferase family protein [Spirilliplanes yamanashiensis]|uniref:Dihydrolipoamide acetyltransferase component of pyruvate dehydrogenase complex n=1 Tax=Spirilliplanes yamanashiensis TaxID=42233 RepID=A0A8J3Y7F8_9ACTN|nr:dihydrolipoamide acetyltransferase family protein [Spirilliplanes yamanashiensis]MDP9815061.1 pyruvate dehydrogenase E2 component (dihydrolipoamide acetyltransferase) [Spirilliplanes yamanashiensis]GIJ02717.1 dihydrolipoamide acetyltransferase component of pyruvate dehydrogenase complex [Spirilliplanes yamanashiensis]